MKPLALSLITIGTLFSVSCSNSSAPNATKSYRGKSSTKNSLPRVPPRNIPGGVGDNWRYLGTTISNSVAIEINESSINKSPSNKYKYQDRKTVIEAGKFAYGSMPSYQYSLSNWLMDCDNKVFKINSTSIYDGYGKLIKSYSFDDNILSSAISHGSIAEKQYNYICNSYGRSIGY